MLRKIRLRTFWIVLLVFCSLWVARIFGPLLYSLVRPTADLVAIVRALQGRGVAPSNAGTIVHQVLEQGGPLGRAIHIGHYAAGSAMLNGSRTTTEVADSYIAWFQKIPKPIVLNIRRHAEDGVLQKYEIDSTDSVGPIVQAYTLPLVSLAVAIYLVRKRRSPLLSDEPHELSDASSISNRP